MLLLMASVASALTCDEVQNMVELRIPVRVIEAVIRETVNRDELVAGCPVAEEIALHRRRAARRQRAGEPIVRPDAEEAYQEHAYRSGAGWVRHGWVVAPLRWSAA